MEDNLSQNISPKEAEMNSRIFDLVVVRVLKKAYTDFDEQTRKEMDKVFASTDNSAKDSFIEKNIPNFKNIFEEEAKKIEEELKIEIEKEVE